MPTLTGRTKTVQDVSRPSIYEPGWRLEDEPWQVQVSYTGDGDRWHVEPTHGMLTMLNWSIGMRKERKQVGMRRSLSGFSVEYPRAKDLDQSIELCKLFCQKKMDDQRKFG